MRSIDEAHKLLQDRKEQLLKLDKKARRFPKHGPRRQAVDQIILMLHTEIRTLEWIIHEKIKPVELLSDETIDGNSAWLR